MIRNYYKQYLMIGALFFLITFGLALLNPPENGERYYWILYNRVYFCSLYLPLFLYGMFLVLSDLFLPECIVRYSNRSEMVEVFFQRIFAYGIYYSLLFSLSNEILEHFFACPIYNEIGNVFIVYFTAFMFQCAGWLLIGSLFLFIYSKIKHLAIVWGVNLIFWIFLTAIGKLGAMEKIRYLFSAYHSMYQFMFMGKVSTAVLSFLFNILLSVLLMWLTYLSFWRTDFLMKWKDG